MLPAQCFTGGCRAAAWVPGFCGSRAADSVGGMLFAAVVRHGCCPGALRLLQGKSLAAGSTRGGGVDVLGGGGKSGQNEQE